MTTPAPSVTVTADKTNYAVGDPITITVEYPDAGEPGVTLTVSAQVTSPDGSVATGSADVTVGGTPAQPLPVEVADSFGDQYAQIQNEPGTAVFTSAVGTPPAA